MLIFILFLNAIAYLILLYQYQMNDIIQNNNDIITMRNNTYNGNNTLNDFHVGNNNTSHRFLMQPRIYNI